MSTTTAHGAGQGPEVNDPVQQRFEVVREHARADGINIVHYEPQFEPGSKAERRMTRTVASLFLLAGLAGTAFLAIYIWWPWRNEYGSGPDKLYTPLLGLTFGLALLFVGIGVLTWGKKLLPREVSIQDRHEGASKAEDVTAVADTMSYMADELGVKRRPLLGISLLAGLAPIGAVVAAPLVGGLISQPHKNNQMFRTGWAPIEDDHGGRKLVRLTREDGTPIRPEDVTTGGQMTVFPGIPGGAKNLHADSPTLLIHLRPDDAQKAREANERERKNGYMWGNYIAYSKICTHAGCPASLYEQQTNRLLCPCHQSQFHIVDNAKPIFGPASRRLPQLPLTVDDEGFLVAKSDFTETVGPDFWERP
ncbi:menaquinol-cytochrome c reductase iron-sulfur subunit precursor [Micromonospora pattaloongensis]|uniref:Cytochrome bc1 complex Rieske iron-sulfur subunit n=1 Tax=Micromonospora pattaloongensis TaxID=405436 RepID=A0A1H3PY56_9ACTN|nr:Rieske 2Fe-2S domain-containing protein [Micromonospora pattaloongensis]SDZ05930.1 menaquinol-cytochrome c reductase iron-sulfur subunit precursor [Micromonospora pattaloongensis]